MVKLTKKSIGNSQYDQHQDDQEAGVGKGIAEPSRVHLIQNL